MGDSVIVKSDLVAEIHEHLGLNQRESKEFVENFFEQIRATLERHEEVKLSGFGSYGIRHKFPRPGRNPRTKDAVTITERWVVTFRASNNLRRRVANYSFPTDSGE
ncbi:MAG: integration host factor subunit alpha [Acidiferrobacterales bacterium]|nr:integration host factor subunit alpha [Acidiferrobacterales bacterium]